MGVHRNKKTGRYEVYVYDKTIGKKRYVGTRDTKRGEGGADELFREKTREFSGKPVRTRELTFAGYADEWLDLRHGDGTRRPAPMTRVQNEINLRRFLQDFGDRPVGGVARREALAWAKQHPHSAKTVSAMLNDAIDDEVCKENPFANRRHERPRERKHIKPLTEQELDVLAGLALEHWGSTGYGLEARAWILFAAWVGSRPGETFRVELKDLNFRAGEVSIRRVKKRGNVYPTDVVVFPSVVQQAIRAMPEIPPVGPIFLTVSGRPMRKGALAWHWNPVRAAFRAKVSPERWLELIDGQRDLAFYSLRHFAASIIVDRGGNEFDCAAQLGNSPEVCRETYIHEYRDRANDRNRRLLEAPSVVDLDAARKERRSG